MGEDIKNKIAILKSYLLMKVDEEDWHAVADAAMDLREMIIKSKYILEEKINL